ncbi:PIN domain-containing protein [Pleurocapsales cyanobacterium LEGE 10410]|nr:PIN domain-containing protein [Pleurocapsales cyanobacterium LEGE 10410]
MYVLDTTVVSDYLRGNLQIREKLSTISKTWIYITSVTKFEIEYGLVKKPELRPKLEKPLELLYSEVGDLPFNTEVIRVAATIKHNLISNGLTIGTADLMIGAIALHYEHTVVTSNVKHFEKIEGLDVENWKN